MKYLKLTIILFLSAAILLTAYFALKSTFWMGSKTGVSTIDTQPNPKPDHDLLYSGSVNYFAAEIGVNSFKQNYQMIDVLSLFWYRIGDNNEIVRYDNVTPEIEGDIFAFTKQNQKNVLVGISNGSDDIDKINAVLQNADKRKQHINQILRLLDQKEYDGVVIDYEGLEQNQAEEFTQYIKEISEAIRPQGKTLSVAIEVELTDKVFHGMDIVAISKLVDRMELSAYEEYGEDSDDPGPIASINWVNTIVNNAIDQGVPANKIVMGTSHASHDWKTKPTKGFIKDASAKPGLDLRAQYNAKLRWDEEKQSSYFEYEENGNQHVVWIEDVRGFKAKTDLAKAYALQGVFIWFLGGEDPNIWQAL